MLGNRPSKKKNVQNESILNYLPYDLRENVTSFLVDDDRVKKFNQISHFSFRDTFFYNLKDFYANEARVATHHLLNRIKVKETLNFIRHNPIILFFSVEVKDIHGQRFCGKLLQVLASAG